MITFDRSLFLAQPLQGPPYVFATLILNVQIQPLGDASANFISEYNYLMSRLSNEAQFVPQFNQKVVKRGKTGHPGVCKHEDITDKETIESFDSFLDFKQQNHNLRVAFTTEFYQKGGLWQLQLKKQ